LVTLLSELAARRVLQSLSQNLVLFSRAKRGLALLALLSFLHGRGTVVAFLKLAIRNLL
jgi:hypothetical protein